MYNYHHRKTLDALTNELHEVGLRKEARTIHTQVLTAPSDEHRRETMRQLVLQVRAVRDARLARDRFVLQSLAETVLLVWKQEAWVKAAFNCSEETAAKEAADAMITQVQIEQARRKLVNDYAPADDEDNKATERILAVLDKRLSKATSMVSIHGARAGGMTLREFHKDVTGPILTTLRDGIENLPEGVRDQIQEILDEQG